MLEHLHSLAPDPLLGLIAKFRQDQRPNKIDLGVGVYKNDEGQTPILTSVKRAETQLLNDEDSKSYVGPAGNVVFSQALEALALGETHPARLAGRVASLQTPGGCGALRIIAELIKRADGNSHVWLSDPTWANHSPLLGDAGLQLKTYPYYDFVEHRIQFSEMLETLESATAGDVVLLHACCHNPSGGDLSPQQWREVIALMQRKHLIPLIDMAYQGFGDSLEADSFGLRLAAEQLPEVLIAISCSKNFGLYRERVGCILAVTDSAQAAQTSLSHLMHIVRGIYSMPPSHGASVVAKILSDVALREIWQDELTQMRERIFAVRQSFTQMIGDAMDTDNFQFIATEKGMFSFLGIAPEQVTQLANDYGIYMADSSRISLAGLNYPNLGYFCESLAKVLRGGSRF